MRDILTLHAQRYPAMKAEDGVKLCYQSEFGGGHLAPSREECEKSILEEWAAAGKLHPESPLLEPIGGGLCRLHLNAWEADGLRAETVAGLFLAASNQKRGTRKGFAEKIAVLRELCAAGLMPFSFQELDSYWAGYKKAGYPLCRHSEAFRQAYHPAYRLTGEQTEKLLPLLFMLDGRMREKTPRVLAIDGPSGAGKSSLAAFLQRVYGDCEVFHMDDFFLPPERKTAERLSIPGGNVDWERFQTEVLTPLMRGEPFAYRPYGCGTGALKPPVAASPRSLSIVEGVYSLHPALQNAYDMRLFLSIGRREQSRRIFQRNGEYMHRRFLTEWIPLEDQYFLEMRVMAHCDLALPAI